MSSNALNVAMAYVYSDIPPQILEMAVLRANREFNIYTTVDQFIKQKIFRERVLLDCNLTGGKLKKLQLKNSYLERTERELGQWSGSDGGHDIFRVPPEARDNLAIVHCISVQHPYTSARTTGDLGHTTGGGVGYDLHSQVNQVLNSYTLGRPLNNPVGQVLSGDIIKISPSQYNSIEWICTVRLAIDPNLEQIQPSAIEPLATMIRLATKAWCYTNLIIDVDRAAMECGVDIGMVRQILDEYRDANQMYEEAKPAWFAAQLLDSDMRRQMMKYAI